MEAKLLTAEKECFCKAFVLEQRKEEGRDAVVPDTQPDISEVLLSGAKLLIRSKDVLQGKIRIEAAVVANILYKGDDGKIWSVEINTPFFFSVEDERIGENAEAMARLLLLSMDAKAINPRKVQLRTELCCEMSIYEKSSVVYTESVEEGESVKSHHGKERVSIISCVGEKTFSLLDEISVPGETKGNINVLCFGIESKVDELKTVGSKMIVKGRIKSRLAIIDGEENLSYLEPITDFSQIIELKQEIDLGACDLWLTPSGAYCGASSEEEGKISLEYHMVAQFVCCEDVNIEYVDEVYSNIYNLDVSNKAIIFERNREESPMRETFRHLYESPLPVKDVVCSLIRAGKPSYEPGKMIVPYYFSAICANENGLFSEKHRGDISFKTGKEPGNYKLKNMEIKSWSAMAVPGGMEIRMDAEAQITENEKVEVCYIDKVEYDEESIIDTSSLPSLVLLRFGEGDKLWDIAKENCSCVDAIMEVNEMEKAEERIGKLILIPKTS